MQLRNFYNGWTNLGKLQCTIIGGTIGVLIGGVVIWRMFRKRKWTLVGRVSELYIYPIKSGKYIKLSEAECTPLGLSQIDDSQQYPLRDRGFVVYQKDDFNFAYFKNYPKIVNLSLQRMADGKVILSMPGESSFVLEPPIEGGERIKIGIWHKERIPAIDCGAEAGKWISKLLTMEEGKLGIGYWSEAIKERRNVMPTINAKLYKKLRNDDTGAYSHLSSFMLLNKASVEDINLKIDKEAEFSTLNYRPNIVMEGAEPYAEDNWDWIKIGEKTVFRNFKPCTRCPMVTIDPETGVKNPEMEPLKTLRKYRQLEDPILREAAHSCPVMGAYIGLYKSGIIKLNDPIYVR